MKRFYTMVSVAEMPGGFAIHLDGRPVRTPGKAFLLAHSRRLAEVLQAEWAGQGEQIIPDSMPLTQILNTRIDKISGGMRPDLEREVLKYLHTDLLCYPCEEPLEVAQAQHEVWGPWRSWFEKTYGAPLKTTTALGALRQEAALEDAVMQAVQNMDDGRFTVLQLAVPLSGSLVLGLAFTQGAASADDVMKAAFAEEDYKAVFYKADQYGPDPLTEKRRKAAQRDLDGAAQYLSLLQK